MISNDWLLKEQLNQVPPHPFWAIAHAGHWRGDNCRICGKHEQDPIHAVIQDKPEVAGTVTCPLCGGRGFTTAVTKRKFKRNYPRI